MSAIPGKKIEIEELSLSREERQEYLDSVFTPKLTELMKDAAEHGISTLVFSGIGHGHFTATVMLDAEANPALVHILAAARALNGPPTDTTSDVPPSRRHLN